MIATHCLCQDPALVRAAGYACNRKQGQCWAWEICCGKIAELQLSSLWMVCHCVFWWGVHCSGLGLLVIVHSDLVKSHAMHMPKDLAEHVGLLCQHVERRHHRAFSVRAAASWLVQIVYCTDMQTASNGKEHTTGNNKACASCSGLHSGLPDLVPTWSHKLNYCSHTWARYPPLRTAPCARQKRVGNNATQSMPSLGSGREKQAESGLNALKPSALDFGSYALSAGMQ